MNNMPKAKRKTESAVDVSSTRLLGILADIRAAVGDPTGKLMQDELVEHCRNMRTALETISTYYRGDERSAESVLEMRRIAKRALWPNASGELPPPGQKGTNAN